jgi:hypothetical protein
MRTDAAGAQANNGKERKDLYSDNWDGDKYKGAPLRRCAPSARTLALSVRSFRACCAGSGFNVLNLVIAAFVLTPVAGLAFAYWSYGTLWG